MFRTLREPVNAITHGAGIILALAIAPLLLWYSKGDTLALVGSLVFVVSSVLLFSASTFFHAVNGSVHTIAQLRLFDHSAIYVLIAGSYTPVLLIGLYPVRPTWALVLLAVVWLLAIFGIAAKIAWRAAPRWLSTALYVGLGWLAIAGGAPMLTALAGPPLAWLIAGGVAYTVGAIVYATKWPVLWPGVFGFHELWHVFVLAGWACHAVVIFTLLAR